MYCLAFRESEHKLFTCVLPLEKLNAFFQHQLSHILIKQWMIYFTSIPHRFSMLTFALKVAWNRRYKSCQNILPFTPFASFEIDKLSEKHLWECRRNFRPFWPRLWSSFFQCCRSESSEKKVRENRFETGFIKPL